MRARSSNSCGSLKLQHLQRNENKLSRASLLCSSKINPFVTCVFTLYSSSVSKISVSTNWMVFDVNSEARTRQRQRLMIDMLERKIRSRARQIYEERGREEGRALEDWVKAEAEIIESSILAPLWSAHRNREPQEY